MANTNYLNYGDKINYYEGVVVDVKEDGIALDVLGRLGIFDLPYSMFEKEFPFKRGQTVGWKMSFVEQLPKDADDNFTSGVMGEDGIMYMEGVVNNVEDCAISMNIKDNLGTFKTPMRMLISEVPFENGQLVGWNMSKITQLGPEVNEKYVSNIQNRERRAQEISNRNK